MPDELYYEIGPKSMGKRELLLIVGFVLVGAVLYQFTAPAREPGESILGAGRRILDEIRREVRGRPATAEITRKATFPVPPAISELRVTMQNTPIVITGEDRTDIAAELWVRSNGIDDAEAKSLAERARLTLEPAGPTMTVALTYPPEGSQRGRVQLRVPSGMHVRFGRTNVRIEVTGVAELELESARGETLVTQIAGRVSVEHRGGDLTVEDAGSVRLTTRGSELRLARVRGETTLQVQAGEVRAEELLGPVEIEAAEADITLEHLQNARGPFRITALEGSLTIRDLAADARIDGRETEIDLAMAAAASVAVFNTDDRIEITLPPGGYTLDAVATDGRITIDEAIAPQIAVTISGENENEEQRAAATVRGGGPTITLRANSGEIRVNGREP